MSNNCTGTEKRLSQIIKNWFITEPLLFSVTATHNLVLNDDLSIPMRTGRNCIEFSDSLASQLTDEQLTDFENRSLSYSFKAPVCTPAS